MSFLHFSVAEESKGNETVLASLQLDRTEIQLQKGYRTQIHATVLNLPKGVRASKYAAMRENGILPPALRPGFWSVQDPHCF